MRLPGQGSRGAWLHLAVILDVSAVVWLSSRSDPGFRRQARSALLWCGLGLLFVSACVTRGAFVLAA